MRKLVKESLQDNASPLKESVNSNGFNENTIGDVISAAASGNRIKVNGKVIYAGLGDRTGLYDYANEVISDTFARRKDALKKKLEALNKYEDTIEIWSYYNSGRYKGKWEKDHSYHVSGPAKKMTNTQMLRAAYKKMDDNDFVNKTAKW